MRRRCFGAITLTLLVIGSADALGQVPRRFELTPYAAHRFGGSFEHEDGTTSIDLDDANGFGLIFNVRESAKTQWEVIYARQDTSADTSSVAGLATSTDVRFEHLQGGGTYEFDARPGWQPFLAATLGGTHVTPRWAGLQGDTFWSMSIGTGVAIRPSARIGFRLEARVWGMLVDSDTRLFCISSGGATCEIEIDGRVLWQLETFAGVTVRF